MVTEDSISLLKECDAGIKMGISAIEGVVGRVDNQTLSTILHNSKNEHEKIQREIQDELDKYGFDGKEPSPVAKGMSWLKTNLKMAVDETENTASDLITDGCNMGIKTLQRYRNEYKNADDHAKQLADRIIAEEEHLLTSLKQYL